MGRPLPPQGGGGDGGARGAPCAGVASRRLLAGTEKPSTPAAVCAGCAHAARARPLRAQWRRAQLQLAVVWSRVHRSLWRGSVWPSKAALQATVFALSRLVGTRP